MSVLCVVGFGTLLAACGPSSKDHQALVDENVQMRNRIDDQGKKIDALEMRVATAETKSVPQGPVYPPEGNDTRTNTRIKQGGGGETINLGANLFPSGSEMLTVEGKKAVDAAIAKIKSQHSGASITVEGYADNTPISKNKKFKTNEALSQARAETVMKYMASKGISSSRMSAVGYGAVNRNGKPASRRVELVIAE